ncbi:ABC transporter substrate-binding protein [Sinorhizobium psoraleae]|uniref:ABC transporter substrate-binding protein n=1 Tax=Sinorhizobium psoraleae TaxID=520838 RepID=A0ABT4KA44_9HYPH|nr:ABC transporter substrate-binding protein [Sinorhizobium psoraleae]MCZ4088823.1 ABC transporter substrate-binding protein [Sinorhizobium psoraleae]
MDLQMTLVQDGYASEYASPEAGKLPSWANYKNMLYATTVEPIGVIYNTKALSADKLPKTYAEMITFLRDNKAMLQGKVATLTRKERLRLPSSFQRRAQPERFLGSRQGHGEDGAKIYSSSGGMKETVVSGENVIAINIIGSYALDWVKESPNLGVHFASDYTPAFSRLALITKDAPHSNAAKLFVDYMLSAEGQALLAEGGLPSVREDVTAGLNIKTLNERVGGGLKPIAVDEGVLEYMDQMTRPVPQRLEGSPRPLMLRRPRRYPCAAAPPQLREARNVYPRSSTGRSRAFKSRSRKEISGENAAPRQCEASIGASSSACLQSPFWRPSA